MLGIHRPSGPVLIVLALSVLLAACAGPRSVRGDGAGRPIDVSTIADAVPRVEAKSRSGNPASYTVFGRTYHVLESSQGYVERGVASWYGRKFHGNRTSSGEIYNMYAMTAAHKTLPLPSYARVTNLQNGRSVVVKINDRGPFHDNRLLDLSYAAATKLGIRGKGTGLVEVRVIDPRHPQQQARERPAQRPGAEGVYIQVGAFGSRQNAERLRRELSAHAIAQVRVESDRGGPNTLYRVRIGPLASVELADKTVEDLRRLGVENYHIVID